MEQIPLTPEVTNETFEVSGDFVIEHKEQIVDFFGDNRDWYKKLVQGNTNRAYDISTSKTSMEVTRPKNLVWLHDEKALAIDEDNPPLDPLLINEGKAESIAKFFHEWKEARDDFIAYSTQGSV